MPTWSAASQMSGEPPPPPTTRMCWKARHVVDSTSGITVSFRMFHGGFGSGFVPCCDRGEFVGLGPTAMKPNGSARTSILVAEVAPLAPMHGPNYGVVRWIRGALAAVPRTWAPRRAWRSAGVSSSTLGSWSPSGAPALRARTERASSQIRSEPSSQRVHSLGLRVFDFPQLAPFPEIQRQTDVRRSHDMFGKPGVHVCVCV